MVPMNSCVCTIAQRPNDFRRVIECGDSYLSPGKITDLFAIVVRIGNSPVFGESNRLFNEGFLTNNTGLLNVCILLSFT